MLTARLPTIPPSQTTSSPNDQQRKLPPTHPPNLTITPVTPSLLPSYRRIITLLLPIRYPDRFYKESIADPTSASLARCALWYDPPRPSGKRKRDPHQASADDVPHQEKEEGEAKEEKEQGKVVAALQARIETATPASSPSIAFTAPLLQQHPLRPPRTEPDPASPPSSQVRQDVPEAAEQDHQLYIQTLCTLTSHRELGIGSALLESVICAALKYHHHHPHHHHESGGWEAKLGGEITSVYAHVWESNTEALAWYRRRGFSVEEGKVEGYYRRLRPSGARVVRRRVAVGDWLRVTAAATEGESCYAGTGTNAIGGEGLGEAEALVSWRYSIYSREERIPQGKE